MYINYYNRGNPKGGTCISFKVIQIRLSTGGDASNFKEKFASFRKTPAHKVMG